MERTILHCDMNNFYASVECALNPNFKNLPLAVCGNIEERHGIVLAKNYKAKAFGIQTGETLVSARKKCATLTVVPPNFDEYLKYSKLAKKIYMRYSDRVESYGMDECWLDISQQTSLIGSKEYIANSIRHTIKRELGITISVGVSFNKIFAKLGSDLKKPDAVSFIDKKDFKQKIWHLPVNSLLGVGKAMDNALKKMYIYTIGDLAIANPQEILMKLGKNGLKIWRFANGLDSSSVNDADYVEEAKSVGHSITCVEDLIDNNDVWKVILDLCQDIAYRLRKTLKYAGLVSVYVRDNNLHITQWQKPLAISTNSAFYIAKYAFELFKNKYSWQKPIRSIGIKVAKLSKDFNFQQMSFLDENRDIKKQEALDNCIHSLRERFGEDIIKNAVLMQGLKIPQKHSSIIMPTVYK